MNSKGGAFFSPIQQKKTIKMMCGIPTFACDDVLMTSKTVTKTQ